MVDSTKTRDVPVGPRQLYKTALTDVLEDNEEGQPLGLTRETADGRQFVWCQAATTIVKGQGCVSLTMFDTFEVSGTVTTASAIGTRTLIDTGEFASDTYGPGDFVYINTGEGQGVLNEVRDVADDNTLNMVDVWETATSTDTEYSLFRPWLVSPNTTDGYTAQVVAQSAVTAEYYFWGQTKGLGLVLCDAGSTALFPGGKVMSGASSAGYCEGIAATDATNGVYTTRTMIGQAIMDCVGTTDVVIPVYINIGC